MIYYALKFRIPGADDLGKSLVNGTDKAETMRPWTVMGPVVAALGIIFLIGVGLGWLVR